MQRLAKLLTPEGENVSSLHVEWVVDFGICCFYCYYPLLGLGLALLLLSASSSSIASVPRP